MIPRPLLWLVFSCSLLPTPRLEAQAPQSVDSSPAEAQFPWGGLGDHGAGAYNDKKDVVEVRASAVKVGLVGDPRQIRVEGVQAVAPEDIARALATDLPYQAAARPSSNLLALIDVLRDRVLVGMKHSGFSEATATARYDSAADALVVRVEEGPRYLAGAIRIVGTEHIDAEALVKRLSGPLPPRSWVFWQGDDRLTAPANDEDSGEKSPWNPGKPAPFDAQTLEEIENHAKVHLADIGFPFARFRLEVEPSADGSTADLVIEIDDEGPHAKIDEIKIVGLSRHTQKQVLDYLNVSVGEPLDADLCSRLVASLRDSCRFWKHRVEVWYPAASDGRYGGLAPSATLRISVEEYELAPLLSEPLSPIDQCLVRTAAWLENFWNMSGTEEIQFLGALGEEAALRTTGAAARIVVSRQRGCLVQARGFYGPANVDAACILDGNKSMLMDLRIGRKLSLHGSITPKLNLDIETAEKIAADEYKCTVRFGLGISPGKSSESKAPRIWSASIEPVSVVHFAHRKGTTASLDGGVLAISSEGSTCRIDEVSGRILSWDFNSREARWSLLAVEDKFDGMVADVTRHSSLLDEAFDPAAPLTSIARFCIASLKCQELVQNLPLARLACEHGDALLKEPKLTSALQSTTNDFWNDFCTHSADSRERSFCLPPHPALIADDEWSTVFVYLGPQFADAMFPRGSWPWTGIREFAFLLADDWESGPLTGTLTEWNGGYWAENLRVFRESSQLVRFAMIAIHDDEMARPFAKWALDLPEKELSSEIHAILHGDHLFSQGIPAGVSVIESLDESAQATLASELDWPWSQAVSQLIERRSQKPDEPPDQALEAVLVEAWENGGQAAIQDALKSLAGSSEAADETMAAGGAAELTK